MRITRLEATRRIQHSRPAAHDQNPNGSECHVTNLFDCRGLFPFFHDPAAHRRVGSGMIMARPFLDWIRGANDCVFVSNIPGLGYENEMDGCGVLGVRDGGIGIDVHE